MMIARLELDGNRSLSPAHRRGIFQMQLVNLMSKIQELLKVDKLRLMQYLATEMVEEEGANFFVA